MRSKQISKKIISKKLCSSKMLSMVMSQKSKDLLMKQKPRLKENSLTEKLQIS
jgi:hypothetical protein